MHIPDSGFYYHYKHDPMGLVNKYAYFVAGLARNTKDENLYVLYYPLYLDDWLAPASYCVRPLNEFSENVLLNNKLVPRFMRIIDSETILKLTELRNKMYGQNL